MAGTIYQDTTNEVYPNRGEWTYDLTNPTLGKKKNNWASNFAGIATRTTRDGTIDNNKLLTSR